jgi:hypothetical protein
MQAWGKQQQGLGKIAAEFGENSSRVWGNQQQSLGKLAAEFAKSALGLLVLVQSRAVLDVKALPCALYFASDEVSCLDGDFESEEADLSLKGLKASSG